MANKSFQKGLVVASLAGGVVGGGGNIGYQVTFKVDGNDYYVASCQQRESISDTPPTANNYIYIWKDANNNTITFPYTPSADTELYGTVLYNGTLLAHCDDFTDSGKYQLTLTNTGVEVDTSIKKFGTGSWHFVENTDCVEIDNTNTYFNFGSNEFTIDFWFYPTAYTGGVMSAWSNSSLRSFIVSTAGTAGMLFACGQGSTTTIVQTPNNVLTLNTWQHIAVTRSGDIIYIFVNGTLVKSQSLSAGYGINVIGSNRILIGKNGDTSLPNDHTTGYLDEIRILNGTCAWTEDFTPPTQPY